MILIKGDIMTNFENLSNSEKIGLIQEVKKDEEKPQYLQIGFTSALGDFYIKYYEKEKRLDFDSCISTIEGIEKDIDSLFYFLVYNEIKMTEDSDIQDVNEFWKIVVGGAASNG